MSEKTVYIETYGCQMNVADSEVMVTILKENGYSLTENMDEADVLLVNTCAIREHAEQRVLGRLDYFNTFKKKNKQKKIGIAGCMAERMKDSLFEKKPFIDFVVGPDAYRQLPDILNTVEQRQHEIDTLLRKEETYEGIIPTRYTSNTFSAFISITRGCDNMCAYCIVPFTRGRERSRSHTDILKEIEVVEQEGFKEITLIGQNVDKYRFETESEVITFPKLLELTARQFPSLRIRFSTSYPQDFTEEVVLVMKQYPNICRYIHLPVQSGSNKILELMKRGYTREWYLDRIAMIRKHLPDCAISTDIISGFCDETEADHQDTLDLMQQVKYDYAYMFKYSERPGTYAAKFLSDNVPEEVKSRRLTEIIELQKTLSIESNKRDVGKTFKVLIEGVSKKSNDHYFGRTSQNKIVVFPKENTQLYDIVEVVVTDYTSATLLGKLKL